MDQLKKEESYYNESYYDESIEMPTKGKKAKDFFGYAFPGLVVFAILLLPIYAIYYSIIGDADKNISDWNNILSDRALTSEKLTTPTGKPVGFLLPSLACNRTSFTDFGIQV